MIVVDASVAVKWFLKENLSECAITLLTMDRKLVGPTLALYEVAGAISRALSRGDIDTERAAMCQDRWLHTVKTNVLRLDCDHRDMVRASEIAATLNHTLADCVYLAMAERLGATFVTADHEFCDKVSERFLNSFHLADVLNFNSKTAVL